jgi:putative DNA primase/helicase
MPDKRARHLLQEMFGLMLTNDTSYQKIFMIAGPRRSGKGTIGRILTAMIGKDNVVNPTMADLGVDFGLEPLIDKLLAIISDARVSKHTNASKVTERLLSISGEDGQSINRKYKSYWTGRLFTRFLILTNELPRITDTSGALASRYIVLLLKQSFLGKEDRTLTDKLKTELPGILNWALAGLERLRQRGRFVMPQASLDAIQQLEDLASPVGAFIRDWCTCAPDATIKVKTLFEAWRYWCEEHGHRAGSSITLGRDLRTVVPDIGITGRGERRCYTGIEFSDEGYDSHDAARLEHERQRRRHG